MASYFRTLFQEAMASSQDINYNDIRVVGGFDPVQQEYLLTVLYDTTFEDALPDPVVDDLYVEDEPILDYDPVDDDVEEGGNYSIVDEVFYSDAEGNPFGNFAQTDITMPRGAVVDGVDTPIDEVRSIYITNTRSTPIYTRFLPSTNTLNHNTRWNNLSYTYFKAPWFKGITDNEGNVVLPPCIDTSGTVASTPHTK